MTPTRDETSTPNSALMTSVISRNSGKFACIGSAVARSPTALGLNLPEAVSDLTGAGLAFATPAGCWSTLSIADALYAPRVDILRDPLRGTVLGQHHGNVKLDSAGSLLDAWPGVARRDDELPESGTPEEVAAASVARDASSPGKRQDERVEVSDGNRLF